MLRNNVTFVRLKVTLATVAAGRGLHRDWSVCGDVNRLYKVVKPVVQPV